MSKKPDKIEISHRTIIFTVFFLVAMYFLYFIKDVVLQIFVALLIMTILNPTVTKLHKKALIPRFVSVLIVYILVLLFLSGAVALMAGPFIEQTTNFASSAPQYLEELSIPGFLSDQIITQTSEILTKFPSQFIKLSVSIFSNVINVLTVFIFALYFLLAREKLDEQLAVLFENKNTEKRIERIITQLEIKLGGWARGQLILMLIVGLVTYIGLTLLRVPFALPLAILAGILEIIPNIGPTLASIPAILIAFTVAPVIGIATAALAILIQQFENYLLVPMVMKQSVGISPIITLLSLLVGFKIAGVVGAILSVPMVITLQVFLSEFPLYNGHNKK